jgi:hypothetical protein
MGYFGHWFVVRGARPSALRRLGLEPARDEAAPGWRYAFGGGIPRDFDTLLERAAGAGDGVAVGVWIFDSDFGQVLALGNGHRGGVAVRPQLAEDELEHDPDAFAAWSGGAPTPLNATEVQAILRRNDVFAEETVDELFDRLGLPAPYDPRERPEPEPDRPPSRATRENVGAGSFVGYVEPLGSMIDTAYFAPVHVPWRELRHVPGLGDGFLGIWDRAAPDAPMATFPVSRRGEAKLNEALARLQVPLRAEAIGGCELGGFAEPLDPLAEVRIAERDLSYRDARFVLGRGDSFIGLWDREQPAAPIERFRADDAGERAAEERIHALLFEQELSAKATPGARLYRSRTPPELVRRDVGEPPSGMPAEMREMWDQMAAQGMYVHAGGAPWLIVEEDEDERWRVVMDFGGGGRFHLYAVGSFRQELTCRGRFETIAQAQDSAAHESHTAGEWRNVPAVVPPTLMATLRWAQRELAGSTAGSWYTRFDWVDGELRLEGSRSFARVFDAGVPVAVAIAAERGLEDEAAVFLARPADAPRLLYSLDRLDALVGMIGNYLGDVELGEWRELPDDWPRDLATLSRAVLVLAGVT